MAISDLLASIGCTPIAEVRLVRDKRGRAKGIAFVEFMHADAAMRALEIAQNEPQRLELGGRSLTLTRPLAAPLVVRKEKTRTYDDRATAFVSNLPFEVAEDELRQHFAACGGIKALRIIKDNRQRSKGFAYIQFKNEVALLSLSLSRTLSSAHKSPLIDISINVPLYFLFQDSLAAALALNQSVLHGRPINVARSQPPRSATSTVGGGGAANANISNAARPRSTSSLSSGPPTSSPALLVPRSLKAPKMRLQARGTPPAAEATAAEGSTAATATTTTTAEVASASQAAAPAKRSNAYFKKFLK